MELVRLGERSGPVTARTERIAAVWREAGFLGRTYDDVDRLRWEKLICNACFGRDRRPARADDRWCARNEHAWPVAARCAQEVVDVGHARGVALEIREAAKVGLPAPANELTTKLVLAKQSS